MRWILPLTTGVAFIVIGVVLALGPLWHHTSITASRTFDMAIAFVSLLRGVMNVRRAFRLHAANV
jgi:hypothetical protein